MGTTRLLAALVAGAFLAATGHAHDDATLDQHPAPSGGQLRQAGAYHLELVVARDASATSPSPVAVYVTDHGGQKIAVAGVKGNATLLGGGTKASIELKPDGDNRLSGTGKYSADPAMKVVVALTFADGKTEQVRFEPFKARALAVPGGAKH